MRGGKWEEDGDADLPSFLKEDSYPTAYCSYVYHCSRAVCGWIGVDGGILGRARCGDKCGVCKHLSRLAFC